jgi:hypothetical protein
MSRQKDELESDDARNPLGSEVFHTNDISKGSDVASEAGTFQNKSTIANGDRCVINLANVEQDEEIDDAGWLAL